MAQGRYNLRSNIPSSDDYESDVTESVSTPSDEEGHTELEKEGHEGDENETGGDIVEEDEEGDKKGNADETDTVNNSSIQNVHSTEKANRDYDESGFVVREP
jgi:hypothetical protein